MNNKFEKQVSRFGIHLMVLLMALAGFSLAQEGSTEERIKNALSGGPAAISEGARVMDWPGQIFPEAPGAELIELRPGTNGWTCIPNLLDTPGNDPMCLDDVYLASLMARVNENEADAPTNGIGIGYMLQEGTPKGSPPHMMVFVPESEEAYGDFPTTPGPTPWIMFPDTPYAHLMITMVEGAAVE